MLTPAQTHFQPYPMLEQLGFKFRRSNEFETRFGKASLRNSPVDGKSGALPRIIYRHCIDGDFPFQNRTENRLL